MTVTKYLHFSDHNPLRNTKSPILHEELNRKLEAYQSAAKQFYRTQVGDGTGTYKMAIHNALKKMDKRSSLIKKALKFDEKYLKALSLL